MRRKRLDSPHFLIRICIVMRKRVDSPHFLRGNVLYIWKRSDWPAFRRNAERMLSPLAEARLQQGQLLGLMARLGFELKQQAQLEALTEDVIKSSEIEGETLSRESVRSSVARRLGVDYGGVAIEDRRADGVVQMVLDATTDFDAPLSQTRLWSWHGALFPTGRSGMRSIKVATWRDDADGPMQVVSGSPDRERVHYEAPPAERVGHAMEQFVSWFNERREPEGLLRAGIAHLWFVTVHPFEDGNGRIARAIADKALAQSEQSPQRFYSMSSQIMRERRDYYDVLGATQKGDLDITEWLLWFLGCFTRAVDAAKILCAKILKKAEFWDHNAQLPFNDRQRKMLNALLSDFEGKLTAKKWAAMTACSIPTAQRDINELTAHGVLVRNPGGSKNTSYDLR